MKEETSKLDYQLFDTMFRNATLGIVVVDAKGVIREINPFAEEMFGYTEEGLKDKKLSLLIPSSSRSVHKKQKANYFSNPSPRPMGIGRELKGIRKDGTSFFIEISLSSIVVNEERLAIAFVSNVEKKAQAIAQLEESEARLSTVIDAAIDGIITINREGIILSVNPAIESLFGYTAEELIQKNIKILMPQPYHAEHNDYLLNYHETYKKKIIGIGREVTGKRKDGTIFPIHLGVSEAIADNIPIYIGVLHDLTDRKNAEQAILEKQVYLQNYAEKLRIEVEKRTAELKESEEKLKYSLGKERELSELKSRFVSMASHEFRTPLSTILSSTELLEMYLEAGKYEKSPKHLTTIKKSVANLNTILNDFLSLEKLEAGKVQLNIQKAHLPSFADEIKEEVKLLLKPGQRIVAELKGKEENALFDTFLVRNILLNLLSNASKYSPENKDIFWLIENKGEELYIEVRDEGLGIPADDQESMFTRFFRASNVSSIKGTGLGLTIVKRHLDLMQGEISFQSEEGKGTCFSVKIPLK